MIANPMKFIQDMCRALGIDPIADPVHSITIVVRAGDLPRITVEKFVDQTAAPKIVDLVAASDIRPDVVLLERPRESADSRGSLHTRHIAEG